MALAFISMSFTHTIKAVKSNLKVDVTNSTIKWKGYKPTGSHEGTILLQTGNIELEDGTITSGDTSGDIQGEDGGAILTEASTLVRTKYEENQNYLVIPDAVISVVNVFPLSDRANMNMFDVRYQLRLNDLYDFSSTSISTSENLIFRISLSTSKFPIAIVSYTFDLIFSCESISNLF